MCFNGAATLSLRKQHGVTCSAPCRWKSFNGAATLSLRKLSSMLLSPSRILSLQWGRNFIVAETAWQWPRVASSDAGFNGAATLSLRKRSDSPESMRRHNPSFNGAATLSLRKPSVHIRHGDVCKGFNGAATLSLRKRVWPQGLLGGVNLASMGPQLYRCGNP